MEEESPDRWKNLLRDTQVAGGGISKGSSLPILMGEFLESHLLTEEDSLGRPLTNG